jgi:multidrug resistance efflux pump
MHQPATPSNQKSAAISAKIDIERHKFVRKLVSLIVVISAVVITLYVWAIIERHPRTDDATARANVVGIAPRVSGQTIKLNVQDNQAVKKGDVLFEIDPEDYRLILEKAKAELATVDRQLAQAQDTLHRLEPLLPHGFETAEKVRSRPSISRNSISPTARSSHLSTDVSSISTFRPAPTLPPAFPSSHCLTRPNGM